MSPTGAARPDERLGLQALLEEMLARKGETLV